MKYPSPQQLIPISKRQELNQKILMLIEAGKTDQVGSAAIFQAYTGEGGLHGLARKDFDSYHSFSRAKKEVENGQFFTPAQLCDTIVSCVPISSSDLVADITCGMGNFINSFPIESNAYGCEIDTKSFKVASHLYPYAHLENRDVRYYKPGVYFDLIFGNPPFNLTWDTEQGKMSSQEYFMFKAAELLAPGGVLAVIVPMSFMSDAFACASDIMSVENHFNFLCQAKLPTNSFQSVGVQYFPTKVMFFQRHSDSIPAGNSYHEDTFIPFDPELIKNNFISPALVIKAQNKSRAILEVASNLKSWSFKNIAQREGSGFQFRVDKYLFEIKTHPNTRQEIGRALNYLNRFHSQKQPDGMKYEEWEKIRLTENKVLAYLKNIILTAWRKKKSGYSVIATRGGIKIKAHDSLTGSQFKTLGIADLSWATLIDGSQQITRHFLEGELKQFKKLLNRKKREADLCRVPMLETEIPDSIRSFVETYQFVTPELTLASLNTIQAEDVCRVLSRPYGFLAWEQGSGKTVSGYATIRYRLDYCHVPNVFVVAPPIAIKGTWIPFLERNAADFIVIRSLADWTKINRGQIVVIALTTLSKQKRQAMRFMRITQNKGMLLFDESDEITNYTSARSHAVRDVFRRLRYKLLTTGTATRNNISELYGQVELLYNNSINFICDCPKVYNEERGKDKEGVSYVDIVSKDNKRFNSPFPARGGLQLFKSCYSPSKATVFGIQKNNQDVYNQKSLSALVERTIITRKFKEIAGDGRYKLHTHQLVSKPFEGELYLKILEELSSIIPSYYRSSGNSRKDSMLRIVRQLQLLIKSCSVPHTMTGTQELPAKASYIADMVAQYSDERIMIGCTSVGAATFYHQYLSGCFTDRPVYMVSGKTHDIAQRQQVVDEFKLSKNGVLVCTQQSLSSSVSIPECSRVILESLQWNVPKMTQFYYRAIRFTSPRITNVHFIIYKNSIEVNLMALLTAKERLNDFIKTLSLRDHDEVMGDFNLDEGFLDLLLNKVYDQDGSVKFQWGKQQVAA